MSSAATPFGLRPVWHQSGILRPMFGTILTGYATNIFQYAPIAIDNTAGGGNGTLTLAAAGGRAIGSFQGVEYTLTATGRRTVSNWWAASTAATEIVAYYTADFNATMTYEIQANGSIAQADLGNQADWTVATAGSTVTGLSSVALDTATLTSTGNAGLRIIGFSPYVDNTPGDSFTTVLVQISEHQDIADRIAYGG